MKYWVCPLCRRELVPSGNCFRCACGSRYDQIANIPDLRVQCPSWIDPKVDLEKASALYAKSVKLSLEDTIRCVYSGREGWSRERIELRTSQVMIAVERRRADINGWLNPSLCANGPFLDLGCGAGMLIAAAGLEGYQGMGIDVSMEWLVVARKLIEEYGAEPILAAAMAERLPLGNGVVRNVISLDVIEHVGNMGEYMQEIARVTQGGGSILITTPNRYSLTSEPHVFVWGVGLLPRRLQKPYVEWMSGKSYEFTKLLSFLELGKLIRRSVGERYTIRPGLISAFEISQFGFCKRHLARLYNLIMKSAVGRMILLPISPYFVALAYRFEASDPT